jgi:hypothetical protein
MKLSYLLFISSALSLDLNSQTAVAAALKQMVGNLMNYYTKPGASAAGTILQSDVKSGLGFQW